MLKKSFLRKCLTQPDPQKTLFQVLSRREEIFLNVDNKLVAKLDDDRKLHKMLKTLLRMKPKNNRREIINIDQHNYRIFF
ncbi:hypothetical protein AALT52_09105 [Ligilactobacillus faecis]|uniref:Uncharacterized protein n=1 Tax=Ligilactobacillus faecis TaxID=762833 RepID=A0ABV4DUB6_9LACO